ncbi:MAG: hypothetical protein L6R35_002827 [Caloplaca aegaea]|nr:MAG: hypothetical protein L6R35_002827 [Caloplaca aegaea]
MQDDLHIDEAESPEPCATCVPRGSVTLPRKYLPLSRLIPIDTLTMPSSPYQPRRSHSRSRSRSPPPRRRNDDRPRANASGFRWKDKTQPADDHDRHDNRRLERGYRDRDTRERDRDRDRGRYQDGRERHRENQRDRYENEGRDDRDRRRGVERPRSRDDSRNGSDARKIDSDALRDSEGRRNPFGGEPTDSPATGEAPRKKEKKKREPKIAPTAEPMIIVNVNDRLGTKAAIPCLASDSIRKFLFLSFLFGSNLQLAHEV